MKVASTRKVSSSGCTPGLCPHCGGTGKVPVAYIEKGVLAEALDITERRVRQLVQEGVIEQPVRGKGFPASAIADYCHYVRYGQPR